MNKNILKGELQFLQGVFFSQGFCVTAAAEGGFCKLVSLATVTHCLYNRVKPVPTCRFSIQTFFFERCQAVGKEKQNYSVKQLRPGRSETVLCNCGQETVGGYRFGMTQNM